MYGKPVTHYTLHNGSRGPEKVTDDPLWAAYAPPSSPTLPSPLFFSVAKFKCAAMNAFTPRPGCGTTLTTDPLLEVTEAWGGKVPRASSVI